MKAISTNADMQKLQKQHLPRRPTGMMGPEDAHAEKLGKQFDLGRSESVLGALDYKAERIKQLNAHIEKMENQFKEEVEDLKEMVRKIGEDNLRLKKLLKEHQIEC